MELKFKSWIEAAGDHLLRQISGGLQGLAVETNVGGELTNAGRALADAFAERFNQGELSTHFHITHAIAAVMPELYEGVKACRTSWHEIEQEAERSIVHALTEELRSTFCEGTHPMLHRIRLVVKRPYDQPVIFSMDRGLLIVGAESHQFRRGWIAGFMEELLLESYFAVRSRFVEPDLRQAVWTWLREFLANAGEHWTLTGHEINAAMLFSSGKAGG